MPGPWIGTQVSQSPQAPHLSYKTSQPCDTQWTFILHLDPTHPRLTSPLSISRICIQPSSSSLSLSYYWCQDGRRASLLGGSISGVFSVSAPDKVTLPEQKHFLYPASSQDNLGLEPVCNKSLCLQLYQWFSAGAMVLPSVWDIFHGQK